MPVEPLDSFLHSEQAIGLLLHGRGRIESDPLVDNLDVKFLRSLPNEDVGLIGLSVLSDILQCFLSAVG